MSHMRCIINRWPTTVPADIVSLQGNEFFLLPRQTVVEAKLWLLRWLRCLPRCLRSFWHCRKPPESSTAVVNKEKNWIKKKKKRDRRQPVSMSHVCLAFINTYLLFIYFVFGNRKATTNNNSITKDIRKLNDGVNEYKNDKRHRNAIINERSR